MKLLIFTATTAILLMALASESQGEEVTAASDDEVSGRFFGSYGFGGGGRGKYGGGGGYEDKYQRRQDRRDRRGQRRYGFLRRMLGLGPPPEPVLRKPECDCPLVVKYVCGENKKTYENECELNCQGVALAHTGSCEDPTQDEPNPLHPKVGGVRKKEGTSKPKVEGEKSSSSSSESEEGTSTVKPGDGSTENPAGVSTSTEIPAEV